MPDKYLDYISLQELVQKIKSLFEPFDAVQTTTDTVANVIEVPTSAKGLATLKRIGGMSYKCKNLWNEEWTTDYYDNSNGARITSNQYISSAEKISVLPSTKYNINFVSTSTRYGILFFYDINGDFINSISPSSTITGGYTFTTPSNCYYMHFSLYFGSQQTYSNNIMISEGSTALPYEAYYDGIHDSAVTKVESVGANIWDEEAESGLYNVSTGEKVSNANYMRSKNLIEVKPSTEYYIKTTSAENYLVCFDANNNFISTITKSTSGTFTTPSTAKYIALDFLGTTYNHDICINVSNTAINGNYYPYKTYELAIPSGIRSITGYGWGVNENCYNYIDFSLNEFRQYVGRVDLGSLTWTKISGKNNLFRALPTDVSKRPTNSGVKINALCSKYSVQVFNELYGELVNGIGQPYDENYIYIEDSNYSDATALKTSLNGVYLYFELATPVITDVSSLLDEVHIPIEAGGTLELVNTYNNAVPVQVTFDNGLVDVVLTNHNHDIEQQRDIDFLLRGGNLKTIDGQSLVGSGNIETGDGKGTDLYATKLMLIDGANNDIPVFITDWIMTEEPSVSESGVLTKTDALQLLKDISEAYASDVWVNHDIKENYGYWDGSQWQVAFMGASGVVLDTNNELIRVYDNTGQQIGSDVYLQDIGDTDQSNYYFKAIARGDV